MTLTHRQAGGQIGPLQRRDAMTLTHGQAGESITFELPLPYRALSPNSRTHWSVHADATAMYRWAARCAALEAAGWGHLLWDRASLSLLVRTGPGAVRDGLYRPKDVDNALASMKALIDGIVSAGVIPDDKAAHLELGSVRILKESPPGVTVTLEKL